MTSCLQVSFIKQQMKRDLVKYDKVSHFVEVSTVDAYQVLCCVAHSSGFVFLAFRFVICDGDVNEVSREQWCSRKRLTEGCTCVSLSLQYQEQWQERSLAPCVCCCLEPIGP